MLLLLPIGHFDSTGVVNPQIQLFLALILGLFKVLEGDLTPLGVGWFEALVG